MKQHYNTVIQNSVGLKGTANECDKAAHPRQAILQPILQQYAHMVAVFSRFICCLNGRYQLQRYV